MSKTLRWCIASLIFIALLYWVEKEIGWITVFQQWNHLSALTLLSLTLLTLSSYLLRAYRVYLCFGHHYEHEFLHYIRISLVHNALNNFLPMRLGEASFPLMMKHYFRVPLTHSSVGLLWIRLMDLHWLMVLLAVILVIQTGVEGTPLLAAVLISPWLLRRLLPLIVKRLPEKISAKLADKLQGIQQSIPAIEQRKGQLYMLTAVVWSIKLVALTLIMLEFISIPATQALFAVISADFSSVLPIHGLAGSGTFEAAMLAALVPLGVETKQVLLAAVNVHIYLLMVTLFSVFPALLIPIRRH